MSEQTASGHESIDFGPFRLLPEQSLLLENGTAISLGSRALGILIVLARRAGEIVAKEDILAQVWPGIAVDEGTLRVHIANLRRALGDGAEGRRLIATIPGRGYSLVMPTSRSGERHAKPQSAGEAPASHLPKRLTRMVGRHDIVALLTAELPERRFISLVGPGGIGKTTVAIAVADALSHRYRDGAQFVDFAAISSPSLVASAVAALLGVSIRVENPVPPLVDALRTREMLLVFDSCEHLVLPIARLAEAVFAGAPNVHILVTSREALRVEGERVHHISPLNTPPQTEMLTAEEALTYPAVQLFAERASAALESFRLTDENAPVVAEICRRLDGISLAIELAAGRVDAFGVRGVAAQLDDCLHLLTRGRRTALPRHQTLLATLDWSYVLLPESERIALRRLSVLAGKFTLDAAAAVAAGELIDAGDVGHHVSNLVSASLVSVDLTEDTARYRLLETTRAYAHAKLLESGEFSAVARRHAEYFCDLLRRMENELITTPRAQWLAKCRRQLDNLRAALDWAFSSQGDPALGIALTAAGTTAWVSFSLVQECREWIERALAKIALGVAVEPRTEMQLRSALGGILLFTLASGPQVNAAFEKALTIAETLDDTDYRLRSLWGLWLGRLNSGEYRAALAIAERLHTLASVGDDQLDLAVADRAVAFSWHFLGDQIKARTFLESMAARPIGTTRRSLIIRYHFDPLIIGRLRYSWILWLLGYPDQARRTIDAALDDLWSVDHGVSVCIALGLGPCQVALATGQHADAERYIDAMAEYAARYSLSLWQNWARCLRGVLLIEQGKADDGMLLLRDKYFWPEYAAIFVGSVARALGASGDVPAAMAIINDAIAQAERREEGWHMAELLRIRGALLAVQSPDDPAAEEQLNLSLAWAQRQHALSWELRTATSLARLRRDQGRVAEARAGLSAVYGRFTEGADTADLQTAQRLLGDLR